MAPDPRHITIYRTPDGWMADYHGDHIIRELFGTDQIPTAFTSAAEAPTVLVALRLTHPGTTIDSR